MALILVPYHTLCITFIYAHTNSTQNTKHSQRGPTQQEIATKIFEVEPRIFHHSFKYPIHVSTSWVFIMALNGNKNFFFLFY